MTEELASASVWTLFRVFLGVTLSGFGGVLPFARRVLVEQKNWLTPEDFNETLAICQGLPGPNIVNMSVVLGARARGWRGSLAALAGLIVAPVAIVIALAAVYARFAELPPVHRAVVALAAAAAGLVAATAARMAEPLLRTRALKAAPVMAAALVAVGVLHFPLLYVMLVLAPISIALAWTRPA